MAVAVADTMVQEGEEIMMVQEGEEIMMVQEGEEIMMVQEDEASEEITMVREDEVDIMKVHPLSGALCLETSTMSCQLCGLPTNPKTLIDLAIFSRWWRGPTEPGAESSHRERASRSGGARELRATIQSAVRRSLQEF
jgi:hypothetical protein